MKAILIARVSTEEQRDAGNSLPAQINRMERYCQTKGYPIIKTYSFDESAYTNNRFEFDRIIDEILQHKEKIVVCADKVDRLSRNIFDKRIALLYEKALNDELELHFTSEGQILNSRISAAEKFQFSITLGLSRYYSDAISDNVKRSQEQKIRKGEWLSKAPFGYKNIQLQHSTDIIVDEYASAIVKQTFELYASKAFSMDLLRAKIKDQFNITWAKGYLAKLLSNKFYYGVMVINYKEYPHRYPPIISQSLYEQVQQVKEGYKKKPAKIAGKRDFLYRGMIRCACGLSVTPEEHKGFVYYHCTQYKGKHGAKWLREEKITEELTKVFVGLDLPKPMIKEIETVINQAHDLKNEFHKKEVDKLLTEQKKITKMLENLYFDKLDGSITTSEYDKYFQTLSTKNTDITMRLDQLEDAGTNFNTNAKLVLELLSDASIKFLSSKVEQRRQLIKLVLSNLRIDGENLLYDVVKPFDLILKNRHSTLWRG